MSGQQKLIEFLKTLWEWLIISLRWLDDKLTALLKPASEQNGQSNNPDEQSNKRPRTWLYILLGLFVLSILAGGEKPHGQEIPYSQFLTLVNADKVENAVVTQRFRS